MDSKRQSTTGRVATPKAVGATVSDLDGLLTKAIGSRVRITTHPTPNTPSTLEGILFTYSSSYRLLALTSSPKISPSSPTDYRLLPLGAVASVTTLGNESFDEDIVAIVAGGKTDPKILGRREELAVQSIKAKESTRNRNAGKEGQAIFDWIGRQLPTRWAGTSIIVNDNVKIDPPYRIEDAKSNKAGKQAETHVRKVLGGYYERNGASGSGASTPATTKPNVVPALPRKGG